MADPRTRLLERLVDDIGRNGLGDRSLRELAQAVGSSHRMLNYHFGSRAGLVAALVEVVEAGQRDLLGQLAAGAATAEELVMALWHQVSAPELRPFVRLFFECVAATGGVGLTEPWLAVSAEIAGRFGLDSDEAELRMGVAVTRGLLIDVLASGDAGPATESMQRFVAMWERSRR